MPTAHERAAEGPRTTPPEIEPGDVVTLKTDGRPYVSIPDDPVSFAYGDYLLRRIDGDRVTTVRVYREEIATVRRPAPLLVLHDANPPTDTPTDPADWLDADGIDAGEIDPNKADPTAGLWPGRLLWDEKHNGQHASRCGRFLVTPKRDGITGGRIPETFFATDQRVKGCFPNSGRWSPDGSLDECREWCEERAAEPVAETPPPAVVRIAGCEPPF